MDNLKGCQVHVFDHCQQVTIDDCEDSTIVIGPCQDSVFARDCKNCVIHVVAQQLRTRGCLDCTFFLWVPTEPVIEASVGLRIGAWHVSYPGLSRHMQAAQLNPTDPNSPVIEGSVGDPALTMSIATDHYWVKSTLVVPDQYKENYLNKLERNY